MLLKPQNVLIPVSIGMAVCAVMLFIFTPFWIAWALVALAAICLATSILMTVSYRRKLSAEFDDIFKANASASAQIMNTIGIPATLFNANGRIIWANEAFVHMFDGRDIKRLLTSFNPGLPPQAMSVDHNGRSFQVMNVNVERSHAGAARLVFQYWLDRTEAIHYTRLYEESMPVVAIIYVDNYDELTADKQFHRNSVTGEVENRISKFASSVNGVYRRYDTARFFIIFEAKYLKEVEDARFRLLEEAHSIDTGTEQPVTLSIAVGAEANIATSDDSARQAMELALGRGGDQAIVKRGTSYSFYGGKRQLTTTKQSRVKARLFAKALRQLMENSDQIFIMGHAHGDMDCLGAALGLMRCAQCVGTKAWYVLDEPNTMIEGALKTMAESKQYHDSVRTPEQAMQSLRPSSTLIVVDTQRTSAVLSSKLYGEAERTVIIDHHRRPVDALQSPTLNYYEAGSSSACEMVTEIIQYFDEKLKPTAFECSALLAGMTMDTKSFALNTGARTFEAASFLRRCGADSSLVKLMYQDDMQSFRNRSQVVQNALIMEQGIAISSCPKEMPDNALIAAQAADSLLSIKGIEASFVLADRGDEIMISGRSLGDINVQIILERIGGGGHLTVAGAQLKGVTLDEAVNTLTDSIHTYLKEVTK